MYSSSKINVFECWWEDVNEYAWLETQFFDRAKQSFLSIDRSLITFKCKKTSQILNAKN